MDFMSVDHPDELFESLDDREWTLGDRIAFVERLIQLELMGSRRSTFELMLALHQLEDIRMAVYETQSPSLHSASGENGVEKEQAVAGAGTGISRCTRIFDKLRSQ